MLSVTLHWKERKNSKTGYLIIRGYGKPVWEPLGLKLIGAKTDKLIIESAERIRAKRLIEITEKGYEVPPTLSNRDFIAYYKKVIAERPDYERKASVYKHLVNFTNGQLTFKDINESFWNNFKQYLTEQRKHKQSTIHLILRIFKSVLNRAVNEQIIYRNPLQKVKEKNPKVVREFLTIEELQKLKDTPCGNNEVKRAFFFSCFTGLRVSDVRGLKKKNIEGGKIAITMEKTDDGLVIPYDYKILKYLPNIDRLGDDDYLFSLPAQSSVSNFIRSWVAAAEINKKITYHSSRHTYATLHLTYGTSIEVLKELLGHKDVRETQIYAKIIDKKKAEAVKNLPEL